jgi:glycosyltransferase involved in cell wall biosynthesis
MQPVLSILVITHNQRDLLKRCLDSVLGQKLNVPFEVIVSDDRSDDGTAEFMADLQNQITNDQLQITNSFFVGMRPLRVPAEKQSAFGSSGRCSLWFRLAAFGR